MSELSSWLPTDRLYDESSYLWVKEESESGNLLVGIGHPTIESLGELSYLTLSGPGTEVKRGESVGSMEAAKMTGEIVSPVSGTIVRRNERVLEDPRTAGGDPYRDGWLFSIAPTSWDEDKFRLLDSGRFYDTLPEDLRGPASN
ncbi:MAG: hypothetical protein OXI60_09045 [Acidiferrobacterales bacterium]|nr:hypothetical protein [Acidiferrobacterales bacterium]